MSVEGNSVATKITVPGVVATVIFVVPAPIRLTYLGISSTPAPLIEAAESFGATKKTAIVDSGNPLCHTQYHGRAYSNDHAFAFHGGDSLHGGGVESALSLLD